MVLVTHKLAEIKKIADRVTVLRGGLVVATSDNPAAEIDALVRAMIQGNVEAWITSAASLLGLEPVRHVGHGSASDQTPKVKVEALQIDGLTVKDYQGVTRLDNFTLTVDRGEIVGVAGVEGNGQSELTAVLAGMMAPTDGRIYLGDTESHRPIAEGNYRGRGRNRPGRPPCRRLHHRYEPRREYLPQPSR